MASIPYRLLTHKKERNARSCGIGLFLLASQLSNRRLIGLSFSSSQRPAGSEFPMLL